MKTIRSDRGGYELVHIPGGTFMMGSPNSEEGREMDEESVCEIRVEGFYMGRYPVTNEEYGLFLAENPDVREPAFWGDRRFNQPKQPVVGVSWLDAVKYAEWVGLRLPTEAEWEYACRAGTKTRFYTGDSEKDLDRAGWYDANSKGILHPVGEKEPNGFGLFDMHGNVWEWTSTLGRKGKKVFGYPYHARDGREDMAADDNTARVVRGGSWGDQLRGIRSAFRYSLLPDALIPQLGFRLVKII